MRYLLIVMTLFTCLGAGEETPKTPELPYEVRKAQDAHAAAMAAADKAYQAAIKKAALDYHKVIDKEVEKATKAGNLDLALYLRDQVRAAVVVAENAESITPATNTASKTPAEGSKEWLEAYIAHGKGAWQVPERGWGPYIFQKDGTAMYGSRLMGKWWAEDGAVIFTNVISHSGAQQRVVWNKESRQLSLLDSPFVRQE